MVSTPNSNTQSKKRSNQTRKLKRSHMKMLAWNGQLVGLKRHNEGIIELGIINITTISTHYYWKWVFVELCTNVKKKKLSAHYNLIDIHICFAAALLVSIVYCAMWVWCALISHLTFLLHYDRKKDSENGQNEHSSTDIHVLRLNNFLGLCIFENF